MEARKAGPAFRPSDTVPAQRSGVLPFASEVPVAMIADDFTFNSFREEFQTSRLTPSNWKRVFEEQEPQVFFCESAWQGGPPATHEWQGKIYASVRWPQENRSVLLEILAHCRARGIPTVFWNKEDPTHFSDRINDFVRTACLFDYVFTTAEECIEDYVKNAGARHADVLPFAVQPQLFNPRGSAHAEDTVNFAGTWYAKYRERSRHAEQILDLVLESGRELVIYDRMSSSSNPAYAYPERFQAYVRPAITHEETAHTFRASRFGITLNTVTDSSTMFARRVFELAACGSVVLSNSALGVQKFFGDSVIYADTQPERFLDLTSTEFDDLQIRSMKVALDNTYGRRAEKILSVLGIPYQSRFGSVAGMSFVRDHGEYERMVESGRENAQLRELIAVTRQDAEQGLLMSLMRRRDRDVTVINEQDLRHGTLRVRNYLSSRGVITANDDLSWGTAGDVSWLTAHAQYEPGIIRKVPGGVQRFRYGSTADLSAAYIPAESMGAAFSAPRHVSVYYV